MSIISLNASALGSTIRIVTINNVHYMSIRDIIVAGCNQDGKQASTTWKHINCRKMVKFQSEIAFHQFPGVGQKRQGVITFSGAIQLLMILPGKYAAAHRVQFADIIQRYADGDETLCEEIIENKKLGHVARYEKLGKRVTSTSKNEHQIPTTEYVYATKSDAFPGLIKIGKTVDMAKRLSQLNTGCAPSPHYIVAIAPTFNYTRDEQAAHSYFATSRRAGEFFEIQDDEVKIYFSDHIMTKYQQDLAELVTKSQGQRI